MEYLLATEGQVVLVELATLHRGMVYEAEGLRVAIGVGDVDDFLGILQGVVLVAHPEVGPCQGQRGSIVVEVGRARAALLIGAVAYLQRVVLQGLASLQQVGHHQLHGLTHRLLRHHVGGILRHVGHTLGVVVHRRSTGEEAHQVEIEETAQSVGLALVGVVVVVLEFGGVGLVDVAYHDVEVGYRTVGAAPYGADGALHIAVAVVVVVGVSPGSVAVDVIVLREHLGKADAHVQSVHRGGAHGGVYARELVLVTALAPKLLVFLDLRLRAHVEPVVA